jgi:hypothetical protein
MSRTKERYCEFDGSDVPDMDAEMPEPSFIAFTRSVLEHIHSEWDVLYETTPFPTENQYQWVRTFMSQPPSHRLSGVIRSLDARVAA